MFKSLFGRKPAEPAAAPKGKRLFVLGLDGVPHSFISAKCAKGELPALSALFQQGSLRRMDSVLPCISSVAWATFQTGVNPARHGIFGFVDREPNPFKVFIPTGRNLSSLTLWEHLGRAGKRVCVINVPMTYPPRPVNGRLVSCFLCTDLAKGAYPPELAGRLKGLGYRIDADAWLARKGEKQQFLDDLNLVLEKRFAATFELMKEPWDFCQLHVMETDRINHFLWRAWERNEEPWRRAFDDYYARIDGFVGELLGRLPEGCELIVLSDHGFCSVDKEVYLNHWLEREGYLKLAPAPGKDKPESVANMLADSRAYSLIPGRVFVNLAGREERGSVPQAAYEELRAELVQRLVVEVKDPETGGLIIARVVRREEVYSGPQLERACDLIAVPHDGYDLKGNVARPELAVRGDLQGMHTFEDAFFFVRGRDITRGDNQFSIKSAFATCCRLMEVAPPEGLEGEPVV